MSSPASGRPQGSARRARHYGLALCVVLALAAWPRVASLPDPFAPPEGAPADGGGAVVASADSYHWLRLARLLREGELEVGARDTLRRYPDGVRFRQPTPLVRSIALAADALGTDVHRAGLLLMIPLACLFVVPLGLYLGRVGAPWAGIFGGVVGSLCAAYLVRSFPYRIDTDGGNLFFAWLVPLCMLGFAPRARARANLAAAALTGLALHAFYAWYQKPGFVLVCCLCLLLHLLLRGFAIRPALRWWGATLLLASPQSWLRGFEHLAFFARARVFGIDAPGREDGAALHFPTLHTEITELGRLSPTDALADLLAPWPLAALGLLGFAWFAWGHVRWLAPLLPCLGLGALGIATSQRYLMYLGPFVGIGWGHLLARAFERLAPTGWARAPAAVWLAVLLALAATPFTALDRDPRPRVTDALLRSLESLRERAPEGAVVAHAWGHGYLLSDVARVGVFSDGGGRDARVEQLLSYGFGYSEPVALASVLEFLATQRRRSLTGLLAETTDYQHLLDRIAADTTPPPDPILVLFTKDMAWGFWNTMRKATWDFERRTGYSLGYQGLRCRRESASLHCPERGREIVVDLAKGTLNGRPALERMVRIREGEVVEEKSWPASGRVAQVFDAEAGDSAVLLLMHRLVYESNFNQMYYLNRYDATRFRPVLDDFPVARAWELLPPPADDAG